MDILIATVTYTFMDNGENIDVRILQDRDTGKLYSHLPELNAELADAPAMSTVDAIAYVRDEVAYWDNVEVVELADQDDFE